MFENTQTRVCIFLCKKNETSRTGRGPVSAKWDALKKGSWNERGFQLHLRTFQQQTTSQLIEGRNTDEIAN